MVLSSQGVAGARNWGDPEGAESAEGGQRVGECGQTEQPFERRRALQWAEDGGRDREAVARQGVRGGDDQRPRPSEELGAAVSGPTVRGWESVVVEESDVVACGGFLPADRIGVAGDGETESEPEVGLTDEGLNSEVAGSDPEDVGMGETVVNAGGDGGVAPVEPGDVAELGLAGDGGDGSSTPVDRGGHPIAPNEAIFANEAISSRRSGSGCKRRSDGAGRTVLDGPGAIGSTDGDEAAGVDSLAGGEGGTGAGGRGEVGRGRDERWSGTTGGGGGSDAVAGCARAVRRTGIWCLSIGSLAGDAFTPLAPSLHGRKSAGGPPLVCGAADGSLAGDAFTHWASLLAAGGIQG
jgi:hypothetical protein